MGGPGIAEFIGRLRRACPGAFPVSFYKGTVSARDAGDGKSEVTWAVELDVTAEARDDLVPFLKTALSDGISGLERDLQ
jgi:hypothetical protein